MIERINIVQPYCTLSRMKAAKPVQGIADFWSPQWQADQNKSCSTTSRDCMQAICQSHCKVMSLADFINEYKTFIYAPDSQKYCRGM